LTKRRGQETVLFHVEIVTIMDTSRVKLYILIQYVSIFMRIGHYLTYLTRYLTSLGILLRISYISYIVYENVKQEKQLLKGKIY